MENRISRRNFLQIGMYSFGSMSLRCLTPGLPEDDCQAPVGLGRVTLAHVRKYQEPSYKSEPIGWARKDDLIVIHEEIISLHGPRKNPLWYRITGGFLHSMYIQRVDGYHQNIPAKSIPEKGVLAQVTVPYTQTRTKPGITWDALYRLYYQSIHWVTGIETAGDETLWYRITDELLHHSYYAMATDFRLIPALEYSPIATHLPPKEKEIIVSLDDQELTAFENGIPVFTTQISSGIPTNGPTENGVPTDTPRGKYYISLKMPSKHMGDGRITSDLNAYELLGVPWNCFFTATGVAFHGCYWHNNFGQRMSHGCVNMRNEDALWIYRWTDPIIRPGEWYRKGRGTLVIVA